MKLLCSRGKQTITLFCLIFFSSRVLPAVMNIQKEDIYGC